MGNGEEYPEAQEDLQDNIEAQALYNLLEQDIVPMFYERSRDGLPREWIARVKTSIRKLAPFFNTTRMVMEYTEKYYIPARERVERLTTPDLSRGVAFAQWMKHVTQEWPEVKVVKVETNGDSLQIGSEQEIHAWVDLGHLTPDDVTVQFYYGTLNTKGEIVVGDTIDMIPSGSQDGTSVHEFTARVAYGSTGLHGISVRVLPCHPDLASPFQRGLIRWAEQKYK